jgi:hypothetical protein
MADAKNGKGDAPENPRKDRLKVDVHNTLLFFQRFPKG